jgi:hypothetical protein
MNVRRKDLALAGSAAAASNLAQRSWSSSLLSFAASIRIGSARDRLAGCSSLTFRARNCSCALLRMRARFSARRTLSQSSPCVSEAEGYPTAGRT